jgi:hypothetical protein
VVKIYRADGFAGRFGAGLPAINDGSFLFLQHMISKMHLPPEKGGELRALRRLQREQDARSPFVFTSERRAPFSAAGFARMVERVGGEAKLGFKAHPHMLRHACGYALAN